MPIYLFICPLCHYQFDKFVKQVGVQTAVCPECGQDAERGIESPSPFQWGKSGGWY